MSRVIFHFQAVTYCRVNPHPWVVLFKGEHYFVDDIIVTPGCGMRTRYDPNARSPAVYIVPKAYLSFMTHADGRVIAIIHKQEVMDMEQTLVQVDKKTRIVAHFNKKHNEDPANIPPWVIKCNGQTHYVHHFEVDPGIGFSSKETPDNEATRASLLFRNCVLTIVEKDGSIEARIGR